MKILHVIPSLDPKSGGPAEAIIPMCRTLLAQGLEVQLVTTNVGLGAVAPTSNAVENYNGVPTIVFESQWGRSFKFSRALTNWLDENVIRFDVVHIHAVFNHACVAATRACRKHRVPYVIRPLGTLDPWSLKQKKFRKQIFWQVQGRRMLRHASAVHYTTEAERSAAEKHLYLSNGAVISLGVDSTLAARPVNGAQHLVHQFLGKDPYVLSLSRIHPKKALDLLIDAFLDAQKNLTDRRWQLVISGDDDAAYMNLLNRKVNEASAQDRVHFTGWVDGETKWCLLRHASLLALPSYQENFGICALEAAACGVPVIVSPHVNLADAIVRANSGWVCPVERRALSLTLMDALISEQSRNEKGQAGKQLAAQFTWSRVGHELHKLYYAISSHQPLRDQIVA